MSWTSPRTVASTIVPLPSASDFSMCGSRWATAIFMTSADWRTNGSCIWPEPNSSPTTFMPSSSVLLTMSRAGVSWSASSRSASRPFFSPSMMRRWSRSSSGRAISSSARPAFIDFMLTPSKRPMSFWRGS
ncbi:hypothetical protein SMICM17S_11824 [Streptomyces microflavus]